MILKIDIKSNRSLIASQSSVQRSIPSFDTLSKKLSSKSIQLRGVRTAFTNLKVMAVTRGHGATHGSKGHAHAVFTVAAVNLLAASAVRFLREQLDTAEGFRRLCIIPFRNKFSSKRYVRTYEECVISRRSRRW